MRMRGYTYREISDLLKRNGWYEAHRRSSHVSFKNNSHPLVLTIPQEKGELSRPLCKRLLKEAGII